VQTVPPWGDDVPVPQGEQDVAPGVLTAGPAAHGVHDPAPAVDA
jgi:hypothetical protein